MTMRFERIGWVAAIGASTLLMGRAMAGVGADETPIPQERQAKLLDRFGDQGIDADKDGALTPEEVKAFFADRAGKDFQGKRGKGGPGLGGPRGRMAGPGVGMAMLFEKLDILDSPTPPENFDLTRFPKADADSDGKLSDQEWAAFAKDAKDRIKARVLEFKPEADTDNDGEISDAELTALRATVREKIRERVLTNHPEADTNADGVLSDEELDAFKATLPVRQRDGFRGHRFQGDMDGAGKAGGRPFRGSGGGNPDCPFKPGDGGEE